MGAENEEPSNSSKPSNRTKTLIDSPKEKDNLENSRKQKSTAELHDDEQDCMVSGFLNLSQEKSNPTNESMYNNTRKKVTSTPLVQNDGFNDQPFGSTSDSSLNIDETPIKSVKNPIQSYSPE